ncbi:MAG TPA: 16S rRNA (cytidine(1402)-2'-O)-methyltransferase [Bacteroidota bacterium]|nr:16S rRNA (cytidine(1402)-2'-O)-methyltransferase [Bacteroidota bacterium]
MNEAVEGGTLYIVSTPIGNLEDISLRAVRILSGVDIVAAEDTRTTRVLLDHYAIRKPLISYHSYNEARRTPELIAKLQSGLSVALVSDAGTPGISDPALRVISSALKAQIPVQPVPGASAFLPALIVSGLPTDRFTFEGFLPVKKGRRTKLERLRDEHQTIILYESPHRLLRTLRDLRDVVGDREIAVARELTKKFEEIVRGNIAEVLDHFSTHAIRGEFVLVIAANPSARRPLTGE